jgi:hypothetical protein
MNALSALLFLLFFFFLPASAISVCLEKLQTGESNFEACYLRYLRNSRLDHRQAHL